MNNGILWMYPIDSSKYNDLREAWKIKLNDSSLQYEPETSQALGFGSELVSRTLTYGDCSRTY